MYCIDCKLDGQDEDYRLKIGIDKNVLMNWMSSIQLEGLIDDILHSI